MKQSIGLGDLPIGTGGFTSGRYAHKFSGLYVRSVQTGERPPLVFTFTPSVAFPLFAPASIVPAIHDSTTTVTIRKAKNLRRVSTFMVLIFSSS